MTLPVALVVLAAFLGLLTVLTAPHAPRLLRHGLPPARPRRFWLSLIVVRELGTAGAAAAAAWVVLANPGRMPAWAAGAVTGALAYVVAEVLAPALGLLLPDALADRIGEVGNRVVAILRRPLERPAVLLAGWVAGEAGLAPRSVLRFAADGRADEAEELALDAPGRQLLARVRNFHQRPVRAVMTPRVHAVAMPVDTAGPALLDAIREHRRSRIPIYRGDRDDIVGVLYTKDLLGRDLTTPGFRLESVLRPPTFVPVSMRAGEVFRELRRRKVHLALVVDEYGGIAGLVTMEDLLGELFGQDAEAAEAP
jgi:CBS domain containing-hemolysin-like protein